MAVVTGASAMKLSSGSMIIERICWVTDVTLVSTTLSVKREIDGVAIATRYEPNAPALYRREYALQRFDVH